MKCCPKCRTKRLVEAKAKKYGVAVDYCPGCKGVWFDGGELATLLDATPDAVELPARTERSPLICPNCNEPMRFFFFPRTLVGVQMCPTCKGLWLEYGEFKEIRSVLRHLDRSGVAPAKPLAPAVSAEPPERPGPTGLKGLLLNFVNETLSSLTGW